MAVDFICCDVSFISLHHIIAKISELSSYQCDIICLFKPQFEVGKAGVNKSGIVKDKNLVKSKLLKFIEELKVHDLAIKNIMASPLLGKSGNQEYLLYLKKGYCQQQFDYRTEIEKI